MFRRARCIVISRLLAYRRKLCCRGQNLPVLALFGLLLTAQGFLIAHRIQHTASAPSIDCALCLAADHQSAPASVLVHKILQATTDSPVTFAAFIPVPADPLPYQSRAPPQPHLC